MKTFLKAALIIATVTAFSACDKPADRKIDTDPPVDDQGNGKIVVTKRVSECVTTSITAEIKDEKPVRLEHKSENKAELTRSTSDKGKNSVVDSKGTFSSISNILKEGGLKEKESEMRYSFVRKSKRAFAERAANTFYQKDDYVNKMTADEGFFFNGKDGEKLKSLEKKAVIEVEYFNDGKRMKEISRKKDGVEVKLLDIEYSVKESKEGDFDVSEETLKQPYKDGEVTVESEVTVCRTKKLN